MTPPPATRSKTKAANMEGTVGEKNRPEDGTAHSNNNNADLGAASDTSTTTTTTAVPSVAEMISKEFSSANLSGEMLSLANIICKAIQTQFDSYLSKFDSLCTAKDKQIEKLESKVSFLENKITQMESNIDDIDQYERRDTVIISGPVLPEESAMENSSDLIVNTIKHHLHVNMSHSDINIAHRLGPKTQDKKRPIIVKLQNRAKKTELVQACITLKPQLHINESLTPKRRSIYSVIRKIRAQHKHLFQQCYTSDGKIVVKLKNSSVKHIITSEQALSTFLDNHPIFKDVAQATGGL